MFIRINPNNIEELIDDEVSDSKKYVISCSNCGKEIENYNSPEDLCYRANLRGWAYDTIKNIVICNKCYEKELEEDE